MTGRVRSAVVLGAGIAGVALAAAGPVAGQRPPAGAGPGHGPAHHDMRLVGHHDLQARSAYQPIVHAQGGRWIAYIGHHGGTAFNPLTMRDEPNGTSIVDVTDPRHPIYLHHIPGGAGVGEAGGAQMVRACSGRDLHRANPAADPTREYLLRATSTAHELWDVTDPARPVRLTEVVGGLRGTHKNWWECETGIAYLVSDGRDLQNIRVAGLPTPMPSWRTNRMTQIFDLSDPRRPVFIRNYGLVGQEPGSTGPVPTGVHGPISTGPRGNRVYFGHGTGANGILQIVDRSRLLAGPFDPLRPSVEDLLAPEVGRLDTPVTMGAHTVFPVLQVPVPEFARNREDTRVRDIVVLVNESVANMCQEPRQMVYLVDVTDEARPFPVASFDVPEASGGFCARGGRFGAHASHESFTPRFYRKLVFVSWFNAGVRAVDIRDPWRPREVAFFIPATTGNTDQRCATVDGQEVCRVAIQTNNVDVDDRGLIYLTDRANTGLHIVELTGDARRIVE